MNIPRSYYKHKYPHILHAHGSDWLRHLPENELAAFVDVGKYHHDYGRAGGRARARSAMRDARGRFVCNSLECNSVIDEVAIECNCNGINRSECAACNNSATAHLDNEEIPFRRH